MPAISRRRTLVYATVVLLLLALGGRLLAGGRGGPAAEAGADTTVPAESLVAAPPPPPPEVVVHVVGAVRHAGLYRLDGGARVEDALAAAGGPGGKAALDQLNLAAPLVDGQQVVVPARSAGGAVTPSSPSGSAGPTTPTTPLRLSTATVEQLDELPGVGPVTAERIVAYRDEHGAFGSVDELDAIPGIGPARLEQLRELVTP